MVWFKVDDTLHCHPKAREAGLRAMGLWTLAGSWSAQYLTDGAVPKAALRIWEAKKSDADALVKVGLWDETSTGWQFHDWEEFQPTKEEVLTDRRATAARQKVFRSPSLRETIRQRDGDRCRYCGVEVQWTDRRGAHGGTYDHVMPDGPSDVANLVVCCRGCNAAKGRRTPEQAGMYLNPIQNGAKSDLDSGSRSDLVTNRTPTRPDPSLSTSVETSSPPSLDVPRANQNGKGEHPPHPHEGNARRALTQLKTDRSLPLTAEELLEHAYRLGDGDPWRGYQVVKVMTNFELDSARNPVATLRARLNSRTSEEVKP